MMQTLKLLERLDQCGIRFMVLGRLAAVVHGACTVAEELDISISMDADELKKLRLGLQDLRPVRRITPQHIVDSDHSEFVAGLRNLYFRTDWGNLNVVRDLSMLGKFTEIYERAERHEIEGRETHVMSLADLIQWKTRLRQEKDHIVLKELELIASTRK